jgi:hypothetical protein
MKGLKRIIRNWLGLNGDYSYPHRFIQLMSWRDQIIGVDGNGDLYTLTTDYSGEMITQLMMKNPLERYDNV